VETGQTLGCTILIQLRHYGLGLGPGQDELLRKQVNGSPMFKVTMMMTMSIQNKYCDCLVSDTWAGVW
jgi:hypothetical protein